MFRDSKINRIYGNFEKSGLNGKISLELGGVRKRPAESGIGFCLAPARAWLYPGPLPASLSVRQGPRTPRTIKTTDKCKKAENRKMLEIAKISISLNFTKLHKIQFSPENQFKTPRKRCAAATFSALREKVEIWFLHFFTILVKTEHHICLWNITKFHKKSSISCPPGEIITLAHGF